MNHQTITAHELRAWAERIGLAKPSDNLSPADRRELLMAYICLAGTSVNVGQTMDTLNRAAVRS